MALRLWLVIPPQRAEPTLLQNTHHIRWLLKHCWILFLVIIEFDAYYFFNCQCVTPNLMSGNHQNIWKKWRRKSKKKIFFFQFLQKETICMRKKQAAMFVVVAEWVRNWKISARHILRFKDKNQHFLIHFIDPMLFRAVQFNIFWMILILACSEPNGMHFLKIVPFLDFSLLCAWMR